MHLLDIPSPAPGLTCDIEAGLSTDIGDGGEGEDTLKVQASNGGVVPSQGRK